MSKNDQAITKAEFYDYMSDFMIKIENSIDMKLEAQSILLKKYTDEKIDNLRDDILEQMSDLAFHIDKRFDRLEDIVRGHEKRIVKLEFSTQQLKKN